MSSQARTLLLVLATAVLPTACRMSPEPPWGHDNDSLVIGRLAQVNPRDIVVMPVTNLTGNSKVPLEGLRSAFQSGLVARRYSPLALDFVDSQTLEASYEEDASYEIGSLQEQGVLQVAITGWDDSNWLNRSRLEISADVHLLDAGIWGNGEALWGGPVTRVIDLDLDPTSLVNAGKRLQRAVDLFAAQVLASLPARDPRPVAN